MENSNYWKSVWNQHVKDANDDPYSQVGRTLNSKPMSADMLKKIAAHFNNLLELKNDHQVLDFCCGNGLLSAEMAKKCKHVMGIDFSEKLIADFNAMNIKNIEGFVSNSLEVKFESGSFDRILFAAAIQHFSENEVITLFARIHKWLKPDGILLITDITDKDKMWNFYNTPERVKKYFADTSKGASILGTWYDKVWLKKLGLNAGFKTVTALNQPEDYWYAHYRFDLLCRK